MGGMVRPKEKEAAGKKVKRLLSLHLEGQRRARVQCLYGWAGLASLQFPAIPQAKGLCTSRASFMPLSWTWDGFESGILRRRPLDPFLAPKTKPHGDPSIRRPQLLLWRNYVGTMHY